MDINFFCTRFCINNLVVVGTVGVWVGTIRIGTVSIGIAGVAIAAIVVSLGISLSLRLGLGVTLVELAEAIGGSGGGDMLVADSHSRADEWGISIWGKGVWGPSLSISGPLAVVVSVSGVGGVAVAVGTVSVAVSTQTISTIAVG